MLFTEAIDGLAPDTARAMTAAWIVADRVRFAIMSIGFIALIRAFQLPLVTSTEASAGPAAGTAYRSVDMQST